MFTTSIFQPATRTNNHLPTRPMWLVSGVQTITPDIAQQMLNTSIGNRNISKSEVNRMADLMTSGKWIFNGATITFDTNGCLTNGHHRLHACIVAKHSFKSLVWSGVDEEARLVDDTHRSKSAGDLLAFKSPVGIKGNINRFVAAAKAYMQYQSGACTNLDKTEVARFVANNNFEIPNNDIVNATGTSSLYRYASLLPAVHAVITDAILESNPLYHAANFRLQSEFINKLLSGLDIADDSPIYALRERLLTVKRHGSISDRMRIMRAIIIQYNNYVTDKKRSIVKIAQPNSSPGGGSSFTIVKPVVVKVTI